VVADRLDDETLRAAYEEQLASFTTVEVAHILVEDPADAERIAAEVTPETFAELAERESIDTASGANGGSLGSFSQAGFEAQFIPEFVDAALALDAGEISAPVQSEFGWHVIYLVRSDVAPFEDVRDQLLAEQTPTVFDAWFREQVDATQIDVNPRFGRYDLETFEVVPVRSTADEPAGATAPAATAPAATGT
jgi:parvulin-like peptidyl-prolyl isomerase